MSITSRRRYSGHDPVEPLMRSIMDAMAGSGSNPQSTDSYTVKHPGVGATKWDNKSTSSAPTRFSEGRDSTFHVDDLDEPLEPEFIFPSPHVSPSETSSEGAKVDPGPQMPIHEGTALLDLMTGDRATVPMRFCPADPPAGSRPYDSGALSSEQQRRLNHLKRGTARDDQRYLSQHPEIGAVCSLLLSNILREQPINVREFCSEWVKRPELHQEVDEFLEQFPPPSRHDDVVEERDWFPDVTEERPAAPRPVLTPAQEALRRIERQRKHSKTAYDHRATLLHRDLLREGAEDMIRRWLDDMLTTALSHRTDYWESFERAQDFIADERMAKKPKKAKTKAQEEKEAAELAEAEKAVEDALDAMRKKVEVIDAQKKAGAYVPGETPGEAEDRSRYIDYEKEDTERVEAVAEALQRLRTVSRGGPSYMAALSEAITRLQEHREGELEKPPTVSERALRWSAIVRGERASIMAHKQDMDDKALRLAAAVASTERKKSIERPLSPRGALDLEEEDEDEETEMRMEKRKRKDKGRKKKMSAKELEEYNLRLSLVFPELADMLHDDEDETREIKEMPFQEQMAQATKDAIEIAMKRLGKRAKKQQMGGRGAPVAGAVGRGGVREGGAPGAAAPGVAAEVGHEAAVRRTEAVRMAERRRRKRLATAVVFEGLDPGQMKQKEKEAMPDWPPEGGFDAFPEDSGESSEEGDDVEEEPEKKEEKVEKVKEKVKTEEGGEEVEGEGEEESVEEEVEEEPDEGEVHDETEFEVVTSEPEEEYQQVAAAGEAAEEGPHKRATDVLREKLEADTKKRTSGVAAETEVILGEDENKFVGFEEPVKDVRSEETRKSLQARKSTVSMQPQIPDTPTPGDTSDEGNEENP